MLISENNPSLSSHVTPKPTAKSKWAVADRTPSPGCPQLLWSLEGNTCPVSSPTPSHHSSAWLTFLLFSVSSYQLSCSLFSLMTPEASPALCSRIQVIHRPKMSQMLRLLLELPGGSDCRTSIQHNSLLRCVAVMLLTTPLEPRVSRLISSQMWWPAPSILHTFIFDLYQGAFVHPWDQVTALVLVLPWITSLCALERLHDQKKKLSWYFSRELW